MGANGFQTRTDFLDVVVVLVDEVVVFVLLVVFLVLLVVAFDVVVDDFSESLLVSTPTFEGCPGQ